MPNNDNGVTIISSDSEVELQLTAKRSKPHQSKLASYRELDRSGKAKERRTKAFLSDSEDAMELTSDLDMSTMSWTNQGRERQLHLPGPTSSSSITSQPHSPTHSRTKGLPDASQMTKCDKNSSLDLGAKRTVASPASDLPLLATKRRSSDHGTSSKKFKAVPESSNLTTSAPTEPSLADVISMSLGGSPSSSKIDRSFWPRVTRHRQILRPSSSKVAPPPADAEVINLCSDSDEAMDVGDFPATDVGPLSPINGATIFSEAFQPGATQTEDALARLSYPSSLRVPSSPVVPASSSLPASSPPLTVPYHPSSAYSDTLATANDIGDAVSDGPENYPKVTPPQRSDATEGVSSVHQPLSMSNSSDPGHEVASDFSNKGSYKTCSSSASIGSFHSPSPRNSVTGSPVRDLVAPVSVMHLHNDMHGLQEDCVSLQNFG